MARSKKSMLYTRSGDAGTTALFGGGRVPKDSLRVEAYGSVDELNSALGVANTAIAQADVREIVLDIQNELFNIGSELASESGKAAGAGHMFTDEDAKIAHLEALIDEYDAKVESLRTFILPGGSTGAAMLHFCRTVCRRAERSVVRLAREEPVNPAVATYLNRLSDLLFVLARYANKADGAAEVTWRKG
jgi:cob(I)alamin adenosyltransferase